MNVDRVRLQHFKCYGETDLRLDRGVTVVHGVNGSGKSTLLEAVFFALYGSKALSEHTLDDVVTVGEDETEIELWFTHAGESYRIHRRLKRRDERTSTVSCVFETPDGTIDGARDVRTAVEELLRMDAEAFVNCAYVRQGEVNKLIHASPSDRQDMIDDLLQLGVLEEYRERASEARLGVKTVLDGQRERAEEIRTQVTEKVNEGLHDRLNELETQRATLDAQLERYEENREQAAETREQATEIIERSEETRAEIADLRETADDLRETIGETERERERLKDRIAACREDREDLEAERETLGQSVELDGDSVSDRTETIEARETDLRERLEALRLEIQERTNEADRLTERAEELTADAEAARERAGEIETALEADEETVEDRETRLSALDEQADELRKRFADAPVDLGESEDHRDDVAGRREEIRSELADVRARIEATERAIEEAEDLLAEGKCPECGQPVADSPHVDVLEDRRAERDRLKTTRDDLAAECETLDDRLERAKHLVETERRLSELETNRDSLETLLAEKREAMADRREQCEQLRERAAELEETASEKREAAEAIREAVAETRSDLGSVNAERQAVAETLETLERLVELDDQVESLSSEIETLREKRASKAELNDERRTRLADVRERKDALEAEFDEARVETAREERRAAEEYLERVEAKLDELRDSRETVQNAIGAVTNQLEELDALRERLDAVDARCDRLSRLYEEAETLQSTYGELRADLRQQNVATLERLLNETFDLVYRNDAYAGIDLDGQYRLTVYQKDGRTLDPDQLSGGERALFNLSLRCAIYRLLAEGVEGAAPMPPLILDEPTVFLDDGHVTNLVTLVESMRDLGVEQIVVVSHDGELVGAADDLVHVETDPTTNRATLDRDRLPVERPLSVE